MKAINLFFLGFLLFGCVSEEEIKARQENAFDISGTYQTVEGSEVDFNLEIINQNAKMIFL